MAKTEWKLENFEKVLVVEGHDDLFFYAEILEDVGKHNQVFIKPLGGKSNFLTLLPTFITPTRLERNVSLGFIVDADENPDGTKRSLEKLLSELTGQTVVEGQWTAGKPKIGLLIMPGGAAKGEIETLVWQSWSSQPANDGQRQCIVDFVKCMSDQGVVAKSMDKALLGSLLAIKHDEDPRLGPSTKAKVFDLKHPHFDVLRQFMSGF